MARAGALLFCVLCLLGGVLAGGASGRAAKHARTSVEVCHRVGHHRRCVRRCRVRHKLVKCAHKHGASTKRTGTTPTTGHGVAPGSSGSTAPSGTGASPGSPTPPAPVTPGSGASNPESSPTPVVAARVQVIAKEYSFTLSRPEVPAGPVIIEFANDGEDRHNLHLELSSEELPGAFPETSPGAHPDQRFNMRPGNYALFCSLPMHRQLGMEAVLKVR